MISFSALYCSRRFALKKNFNDVFSFFETNVREFRKGFVEYPLTLLVRPRALSGAQYTLFATVLLMIEEKNQSFVLSKKAFSAHLYHWEPQTPRSIQADFLKRYYQCILDVRYSTLSCSGRLGTRLSEEMTLEHNFALRYMDSIFPYLSEHGHHIVFLKLKIDHEGLPLQIHVALFAFVTTHVYVSTNCFCMSYFFFFAVMAIQKKPADFHYQTRLQYARGMVQKMNNNV